VEWKHLEEDGFSKRDVMNHSEEVISCIERLQSEEIDDVVIKNEPEYIPDISEYTISTRIQRNMIHINVFQMI